MAFSQSQGKEAFGRVWLHSHSRGQTLGSYTSGEGSGCYQKAQFLPVESEVVPTTPASICGAGSS